MVTINVEVVGSGKLLMDGTTAVKDLVTGASFTMAGTPATGALLGATAPDIGSGKYTSCSIPVATIGLTAGQPITIVCVVNVAWDGDDGTLHYLFDSRVGPTNNGIVIAHRATNTIRIYTYDNGSALKYKELDVASSWSAGTHVVIATLDAANSQHIFVDGVEGTTSSGTGVRESAFSTNAMFGCGLTSAPITGLELCAIWNRVLSDEEITVLSGLLDWTELFLQPARESSAGKVPALNLECIIGGEVAQASSTADDGSVETEVEVSPSAATSASDAPSESLVTDVELTAPVCTAGSEGKAPALNINVDVVGSGKLLMDGTTAVKDLVTGASFTMAGTPSFPDKLLGVDAPYIGSGAYTACYKATPFAAGSPISIMLAVETTWDGDSGDHYFFDNHGTAANSIYIRQLHTGTLDLVVKDATATAKAKSITVDGENMPAGVHIIIATLAADNTQRIFLDGVEGTTTTGTGARETAVAANTYIGSTSIPSIPSESMCLCAIWNRVLSDEEITVLSGLLDWTELFLQPARESSAGKVPALNLECYLSPPLATAGSDAPPFPAVEDQYFLTHTFAPLICTAGNAVSLEVAGTWYSYANIIGFTYIDGGKPSAVNDAQDNPIPNMMRDAFIANDEGQVKAIATEAAVAGSRHVVTGIIASSDKPGALVELKDGTTTIDSFRL